MCTKNASKPRIARRAIWVAPATSIDFPNAKQVFRVRRDVFDLAGNRISKDVVHGVTSLDAKHATPEILAGQVKNIGG